VDMLTKVVIIQDRGASPERASMAEFRMRRTKLPIEVIAMILSELTHA
jgi:hypothetical protein